MASSKGIEDLKYQISNLYSGLRLDATSPPGSAGIPARLSAAGAN
jgi:hypothetical protein